MSALRLPVSARLLQALTLLGGSYLMGGGDLEALTLLGGSYLMGGGDLEPDFS